jgi:hypothetical protein
MKGEMASTNRQVPISKETIDERARRAVPHLAEAEAADLTRVIENYPARKNLRLWLPGAQNSVRPQRS